MGGGGHTGGGRRGSEAFGMCVGCFTNGCRIKVRGGANVRVGSEAEDKSEARTGFVG